MAPISGSLNRKRTGICVIEMFKKKEKIDFSRKYLSQTCENRKFFQINKLEVFCNLAVFILFLKTSSKCKQ